MPAKNTTTLAGCAPTPLASYLKALGILRLVAEQADSDARGWWDGDAFVLESRLDAPALEAFFHESYGPTPLVAPWGARSGFYSGSSESAARAALERIEESDLERLEPFRNAIRDVRALLARAGMTEKASNAAKLTLLRACRAELSDDVLPWLDACYVLTDEGRAFPPLLGTGGNEGSGSYVSAFAQLVVACLIDGAHHGALAASLFGVARPDTGSGQTPGQFAPLAAGGANTTSGFEGGGVLNAWDLLLCLEGTLLFAAAATKRLDASSQATLAFPFTVRAVGAGSGGVAHGDEPNARAETWFPVWGRPASLAETSAVFAEGRVQVSGRTARDGLDFARAVATLGIQRGITSFQRYGYLQRFGRNVIAVPIDRVAVTRNPRADLVTDLEHPVDWLSRFRGLARKRDPEPPARLKSLIARLEDALFDLARTDGSSNVEKVLIQLGEAQRYLTLSRATRESMDPVPLLGEAWVLESDDGSPEFRIAAALAGLHGRKRNDDGAERSCLPMGMHFAPIDERRRWLEGSGQDVTWGSDTVENNLRALVERRLLLAGRVDPLDTPWEARYRAPLHAIAAWLDGGLDSARIGRLLRGLVLARIPRKLGHAQRLHLPVPPSFAVLKPMFSPGRQLNRVIRGASAGDDAGNDSTDGWPARDAAAIARLLAADRVGDAVSLGLRRMRAGGLRPLIEPFDVGQPDGRRLLAALLVPLSDADLRRTLYRVATRDPDRDTNTSPQFLEA